MSREIRIGATEPASGVPAFAVSRDSAGILIGVRDKAAPQFAVSRDAEGLLLSAHPIEPPVLYGHNLITNPRFAEAPDPMYTGEPEAENGQLWGTWCIPEGREVRCEYKGSSVSPFPPSITAAMRISNNSGGTWDEYKGKFYSQTFPIDAARGDVLTLSFDALGHGGSGYLRLVTWGQDASPAYAYSDYIDLISAPSDVWTRFSTSVAVSQSRPEGWVAWNTIYTGGGIYSIAPDVTAFRVDYGTDAEYKDGDSAGWEWEGAPHRSASKTIGML